MKAKSPGQPEPLVAALQILLCPSLLHGHRNFDRNFTRVQEAEDSFFGPVPCSPPK